MVHQVTHVGQALWSCTVQKHEICILNETESIHKIYNYVTPMSIKLSLLKSLLFESWHEMS